MKYYFDNPEHTRRATEAARSTCPETRLDVWSAIVNHIADQTETGKVSHQLLASLRDEGTQRATLVQLGAAGFNVLSIRAALAYLAVPHNPPVTQTS